MFVQPTQCRRSFQSSLTSPPHKYFSATEVTIFNLDVIISFLTHRNTSRSTPSQSLPIHLVGGSRSDQIKLCRNKLGWFRTIPRAAGAQFFTTLMVLSECTTKRTQTIPTVIAMWHALIENTYAEVEHKRDNSIALELSSWILCLKTNIVRVLVLLSVNQTRSALNAALNGGSNVYAPIRVFVLFKVWQNEQTSVWGVVSRWLHEIRNQTCATDTHCWVSITPNNIKIRLRILTT